MKKLAHIVFFFVIITSEFANAQSYGDEWIDYNKTYFKLTLAQDGIYRLTYDDLIAAGFPVTTVDPRRLQLFYKGVEQAIIVQGQGDAIFNTTDYIEFYGQKNDGSNDERLYVPAAAQPHQLYSLYSDSSAYFLTWHLTPTNGKRMTSYAENNVGLAATTSHQQPITLINVAQYSTGQGYSTDEFTKYTFFDYGEGFTSAQIQENRTADFTLNGITQQQQSDGEPILEVLLTGRDDVSHLARIEVGPSLTSLREIGTISFEDYESTNFTANLLWTDISVAGALAVRVTALGVDGGNDRLSTSYIRVSFPQQFDIQNQDNKWLYLRNNAGNKDFLEFINVPTGSKLFDITDPDNILRVGINQTGNAANAIVNNTLNGRKLVMNSGAFITPVIKKANFRAINAAQHDYIIISNKFLMRTVGNIENPVRSYAAYRASQQGGAFDTLVVDMEMLYNQYNYGLKGPLAIIDFMRFIVAEGSPKFLFLIGKGLDPALNYHRNSDGFIPFTRLGIGYEARDLVPSAGNPGSDMFYTAGLSGIPNVPAVPVGRLSALTPQHVVNYLNKVIEKEATPFDKLWRKDLLHLSGGISASELVQFRTFMDGFANTAEAPFLGGQVQTIAKTSGSTVQLINVADEVNKGLNLITFFGHSAPNITDIDIGYVTDPVLGYNNPGKYPLFLINGCNAGNFFNADINFGEDWVLAENKGAIGFIAHSSFGFVSNLRRYSDVMYQVGYGDSVFVSKTIGEVQKEVATRYLLTGATSANNITNAQQMVLIGDPAITLFGPQVPDYEIDANDLFISSFSTEPVTALSDSFAVNLIVRNYGRTRNDSLKVTVTRTLQDNSILTYDSLFAPIYYQDTIVFKIKKGDENGFGNNRFEVRLDEDGSIPELNENNNAASFEFFVPLFGTRNLLPANYGIVNNQPVKLLVQSTDILEGTREFLIQLDTVPTYNSPWLKQTTISTRLLAEWTTDLMPDITMHDSTVYYWRSKFATTKPGESDEWVEHSFTYIKDGDEGWSQSDFEQFDYAVLGGLTKDESNQKFDFLKTIRDIQITTYGADNLALNSDVSVQIDGTEYIVNNQKYCRDNTINLIAFDKNTAVPYAANPFIFQDNRTCGRNPQVINSYTFAEIENGNDDLISYVDRVQEGDSVILFTIGNPQVALWSANITAKLVELGIDPTILTNVVAGEPIIITGKKGATSGEAIVFKAEDEPKTEQQLQLTTQLSGIFSTGNLSSTVIGPAQNWGQVLFEVTNLELPLADVFSLSITGINKERQETVLQTNLTTSPVSIANINAAEYPFLKLTLQVADDEYLTPAQINKWMVTYTPVAEGILIADEQAQQLVKLQEGETTSKTFGFKNISTKSFVDSLLVNQRIFNVDTRQAINSTYKIMAPAPGDTTHFDVSLTSIGRIGNNDLTLNINPRVEQELYYDNNNATLTNLLNVTRDNINPVLDVLFDGRYILNGDIVAPSPLINIRLKDENPYIKVADTTQMNVFIKQYCNGCDFRRVSFSSNEVQWTPAGENTDFSVDYQPNKLENGSYTLRIEAADASGNLSGSEPYQIEFEVINESTITNFYPYPNPFSTSTRFVFTLTGSVIPNEIKIQIMTVSGKVVREITQDELGAINIGNNISDFAWDGRDEFGDRLANGVYLYKVTVKQSGEALDSRSTAADKAFTKGFGKLYILR